MASIDERVVAMSFENAKFEAAVAKTMATLSKLDASIKNIGSSSGLSNIEKAASKVTLQQPMSALDKLRAKLGGAGDTAAQGFGQIDKSANRVTLEGPSTAVDKLQGKMGQLSAGSTFTDIEKAADRVELSGLSRALDNVSNKFSILEGAASVALGNIATKAATKGAAFAKGFAIGPIQQGLEEYQTNLNSIQTILANTQGQQVSGLTEVNKHLGELNKYSDQTIYNFSEMAKNIGTFTAAGVDLDTSTQSIKGIANLAALSGSNSQQASTAMYQLSQAIAAGKVGLQDWNSVVNAGMGGAVFQKALMRTAENMGALKDGAVEIDKATGKATINGTSFRESIMAKPGQESWLTSDVLTKTLGQFTGDLTVAQLKAQGFNEEQIKSIQQTAVSAKEAATQVKTLPQVFDVAKETIGSGWSQTFQLIFGNFEQAKKTFTDLSQTINGIINRASTARNNLLKAFDALGGRDKLILAIKGAFHDLMQIIGLVHNAFRDIFPPTTAKDLIGFVDAFRLLDLKIQQFIQQNGVELERTFKGFFAVLHIGVTIIKTVLGVLGHLLGIVGHGAGGFLDLTAAIGDFFVGLDKALSSGKGFAELFGGLTTLLKAPLNLIRSLASAIQLLFGSGSDGGTSTMATNFLKLQQAAGPLAGVFAVIVSALDSLRVAAKKVADFFAPIFGDALKTVQDFGQKINDVLKSISFDDAMSGLATAGIGGIFLTLKKAIGGGVDLKFFDGVKKEIVQTLNAVNGSLSALQKNIQANTLLQIGAAILVLAAGILILSKIDPKQLTKAMTAVAVGLGELIGAMKLLGSSGSVASMAVMPLIGAALIELAIAVDLLAVAVTAFSKLSWGELVKGLAGVGGALAAVGLGMKAIGPRVLLIGPALLPVAVAVNLLAIAVKIFSTLKWKELAVGLAGVGGALAAINLGLRGMGPSILLIGPGLIALSFGLIILSGALKAFGSMDLGTIAKGMGAMAGSLGIIGLAIAAMPPTMALQAAGLILVGVALSEIGVALGIMGKMKVGTIVKGLFSMGAALAILAVGLTAMSGTLLGSVALLAAAAGLAVLTPVLITLGNLDWGTILKGLSVIALSMATIGVVATIAGPALILFGAGLSALGLGLLTIAGAVYIAAKGISLLASSGQAGVAVLLTAITGFVAILPKIVIDFVKGLGEIIGAVAELAPKVAIALGVVIDSLLSTIIQAAPKLAIAAGSLIDAFLVVLVEKGPKIIKAGWTILVAFLKGINDHIGDVVHQAGQIIGKFLGQLTLEAPRIIKSGGHLVMVWLDGISKQLPGVISSAARVIVTFLTEIGNHLEDIAHAGGRAAVKFLKGIGDKVDDVVAAGLRIVKQFLKGIEDNFPDLVIQAHRTIRKFLDAIGDREQVRKTVDAGFKAAINFIKGIRDGIKNDDNLAQLVDASLDLGFAIVEGLVKGLAGLPKKLGEHLLGPIKGTVGKVKGFLESFSPSRVFVRIGESVVSGMGVGLTGFASALNHGITQPLRQMIKQNGDAKKFGKFLGGEFLDGLDGEMTEGPSGRAGTILGSFEALRTKLADEQSKLRDQVKKDKERLSKELDKKHPSQGALASILGDIRQHQELLDASKKGTTQLMDALKPVRAQLVALAASYDDVSDKLNGAKEALKQATQVRDDAINSYSQAFDKLPDFGEKSSHQVADYKAALREQIIATEQYMKTLQRLRELGLDDQTYKKLLDAGTAGQDFASQLLSGGKGSIDELNALDSKLATDAAALATQAANNLYQAGVDAAKGLVDGLQAQHDAIKVQMDAMADMLVTALKKKLGIKSPSRVLAEIGKFTAEGLAAGLKGSTQLVANAAAGVGDEAASAMAQSLAHISDTLNAEIDPEMTITPVLDLSQVQKEAGKLSDLTNVTPITAAASFGQATAASQEVDASQTAQADAAAAAVQQFEFNQYNTSPESLSDAEIYRQTNNQLSQAKRALGLAS